MKKRAIYIGILTALTLGGLPSLFAFVLNNEPVRLHINYTREWDFAPSDGSIDRTLRVSHDEHYIRQVTVTRDADGNERRTEKSINCSNVAAGMVLRLIHTDVRIQQLASDLIAPVYFPRQNHFHQRTIAKALSKITVQYDALNDHPGANYSYHGNNDDGSFRPFGDMRIVYRPRGEEFNFYPQACFATERCEQMRQVWACGLDRLQVNLANRLRNHVYDELMRINSAAVVAPAATTQAQPVVSQQRTAVQSAASASDED